VIAARQGLVRTLAVVAIALIPAYAAAQPYLGSASPHRGSIEIGGGVVWTAGYDAGSGSAMESPNTTTGAAPLTLFTTSAKVPAVAGVEARAGVYLGPRLSAEAAFQFSRPQLRVTLDDDFENAAAQEAVGGLSSYVIVGSLLYHFGSGRVVPFVSGGGGYLRQLDEDNADVLSGNELHAGGGVKVWFGTGESRLGLRLEAQASARSKSAGFEEKRRLLPVFGAGLVYLF
jgi:hypothetical protein